MLSPSCPACIARAARGPAAGLTRAAPRPAEARYAWASQRLRATSHATRDNARAVSTVAPRRPEPAAFFGMPSGYVGSGGAGGRGARGQGQREVDPEEEVDDREWEMRVASAMLHLRETLPHLFDPALSAAELFPPDVYSRNVVLKLPAPLPIKVSSLAGYSMVYSLAKSGMSALHTDLHASLDRLTVSPSASASSAPAASFFTRRSPSYRHRQIRVLISLSGHPRLAPGPGPSPAQPSAGHTSTGINSHAGHDAHTKTWHTSSLYTFSPYSGLIAAHEVETIRPLPGEGVGEWLGRRVWGWVGGEGQRDPSPVPVPVRAKASRGWRGTD